MIGTTMNEQERQILIDLSAEARRSGDDWGIQEHVCDYLAGDLGDLSIDEFLSVTSKDVWWNHGHVGDPPDQDGVDLDLESAKRADSKIGLAIDKVRGIRAKQAEAAGRLARGE